MTLPFPWIQPDGSSATATSQAELVAAMEIICAEHDECDGRGDVNSAWLMRLRFDDLHEAWRKVEVEWLEEEARELASNRRREDILALRTAWWDEMRHYSANADKPVSELQRRILGGMKLSPIDWQEAARVIDSDPDFDLNRQHNPAVSEVNDDLRRAGDELGAAIEACLELLKRESEDAARRYRDVAHPAYVATVKRYLELRDDIAA